jgi:signal transduction histidine kinase
VTDSDDSGTQPPATTLRRLGRPIAAALVTGVADPPPPPRREWPAGLRWTRRIGIGRVPFSTAVASADLIIAWIVLGGTYGLLDSNVHRVAPAPNGLLLLMAASLAAPMVLRHRHPVAAWRVAFLAMIWTSGRNVLGVPDIPGLGVPFLPGGTIAALLCLYSVAVRSPRDVTLGAGLVSVGSVWVVDRRTGSVAAVLILVPLLLGYMVRQRRMAQVQLAEQERRHQDAEAVLTERQRIARELHDVVAHHMSMIAIQAEAAPYTVPELPDKIRNDLVEIRMTALAALTELRRILGVLRSEDGDGETAPQPGLDRLDDLVAGARGTGLLVETVVTGEPPPLPSGVDLSAYRIIQEALSNAMRHAPGTRVRVEVGYGPDVLILRVVNDPPPGGARPGTVPGTGHGLVGMRERVAMLGGELTAEPTPAGGFAVTAALPLNRAA